MNPPILITGAPGNVGTEVVRQLREHAVPFRVGAFAPDTSDFVSDTTMEVVHFDFLQPHTFEFAFAGIQCLFLVRPPNLANVQRDIAPAIQAACTSGVEQIVFLSLQGVEKNRMVPHHKIERLIVDSGLHYTFLRASFFMQNLSTTQADEIWDRDEIALPVGQAKTSFIDVRDIAAVAVRTLTESGHENRKYTLTGNEALDYQQVAAKLSAVLGRPIRYTNPSLVSFVWRQLRAGRSLEYALVVAGLYTITRFGNAEKPSPDVEGILGRSPITFDQFAQDYSACW